VPPLAGDAIGSVAVKRRSPLTPVLAVVAVGVVAAAGFVLLTNGDEGGGDDPEGVVSDYFTAVRAGDCDAAIELIDTDGQPGEQSRDAMVDGCQRAFEEDRDSLEGADLTSTELVAEEGGRATVRTEIVEAGQQEPSGPGEIALVEIDGEWKVDLSNSADASDDAAPGDPAP
jgi:hypothetical protein